MLERILSRFRRAPVPEPVEKQKKTMEDVREHPKGTILDVQDLSYTRLLNAVSVMQRERTPTELRAAAKLPLIAGIIDTIIREVTSHTLVVREKDPTDDDAPKKMLEATLKRPNETDRTLRVALGGMMRNWMILGKSPVQLLRSRRGQSYQVFRQYTLGGIGADDIVAEVRKARARTGPILGFIAHDPARIRPNAREDGTLKSPAFYDVGDLGEMASFMPAYRFKKMPSWQKHQMALLLYTGTTETGKRLSPPSPTQESYPLIDIFYNMLVMVHDKLQKPQMDKLVSFITPKDAQKLTEEQEKAIVEAMREDLGLGRLPILSGVLARVDEIGVDKIFAMLWGMLKDIELIAWQIFGAGGVQMLRMEGQGRQAATQQVEVAKKQAVGNMLRIIKEDFIETEIIEDPYSPYGGLLVDWVDESAIPSREERFKNIWMPWMERGLPAWVPMYIGDWPEVLATLEAEGIDPKELISPQVAAAMARAGLAGVPEEEALEEEG